MTFDRSDRWKGPDPHTDEVKLSSARAKSSIATILFAASIAAFSSAYNHFHAIDDEGAKITTGELRLSVDNMNEGPSSELDETVAKLAVRVTAMESENRRLDAELDELTRGDGVIDRIVAHVRSLHAQNEATRQDVVDALTSSTSDADQTPDGEGIDVAMPAEGQGSPFSTKAKHTIVTPVVVEAPAAITAPKLEERKHKPEPIGSGRGASN